MTWLGVLSQVQLGAVMVTLAGSAGGLLVLTAGARHADTGQGGDERWHVLADPEGNEFCLLRTQLPVQA